MTSPQFIHFPVDGQLDWFFLTLFAIINKIALKKKGIIKEHFCKQLVKQMNLALFLHTWKHQTLPKPIHSTRAILGHLVWPWLPITHFLVDLRVPGLLYVIRANILRVSMKFNQKGICAGRSEFLRVEHFWFLTDHEHIWMVPKCLRKIRSVPRVTSSRPLRPFN